MGLADGAALGLDVGAFVGEAEGIADGLSLAKKRRRKNDIVSLEPMKK